MKTDMEYASLMARVLGTLIDGIIVLIFYLLTIYTLNLFDLNNAFSIITTVLLYYIVYFTWPIAKYKQTIGYKLMRIQVVRPDGSHLNMTRAFLRYVTKTLLGIASFITYGGKRRQSIHDLLVDSIVIEKND